MILPKNRHFQNLEGLSEGKELLKVEGADCQVSEMTAKKSSGNQRKQYSLLQLKKARLKLD